MDDRSDIPHRPPAAWLEALQRGEADLAAGCTVPVETVLAELEATLDRMEGRRGKKAFGAV